MHAALHTKSSLEWNKKVKMTSSESGASSTFLAFPFTGLTILIISVGYLEAEIRTTKYVRILWSCLRVFVRPGNHLAIVAVVPIIGLGWLVGRSGVRGCGFGR